MTEMMSALDRLVLICATSSEEPGNPPNTSGLKFPMQLLARSIREGKCGTVSGTWVGDVLDPLHDGHYIQTAIVRAALTGLGSLENMEVKARQEQERRISRHLTIRKLRTALNEIIERSNTNEFGTSKVNDMRRIAEDVLTRKD